MLPGAAVVRQESTSGQTTFSFRDVTGERRHDEERARLLARERESAHLEAEAANRAKDDFLAIVSHELRTPLNAMVGWLQLLRGSALPAERRGHALETVERNALAQKKLVEDLLDISRIISGNLRLAKSVLDVAACARLAIDAIRPSADAKELELSVTFDTDVVPIEGDVDRFQQMLVWNLLNNAVKFTPKGGRVGVAVVREERHVAVRVTDSGPGDRAGVPAAHLRAVPASRHGHDTPARGPRARPRDREAPRRAPRRHDRGGERGVRSGG